MVAPTARGGRLRVDRTYPHPRAKLWRALTESELLAKWLMPNDFRPEVGAEFTFRTDPGPGFDGVVHCEVLELDAPRRMTWSWRGGPLDTVVTFELDEVDASTTRLSVTHSGFRGAKARLVKWILGIGNRTLYGKRLPAILDELDDENTGGPLERDPSDDAPNQACMSPLQRVWIAAARLFPGNRRN